MSTKLSQKLERINSSVSRIRQKVELPNAVIEDVATAVEQLSTSGGGAPTYKYGNIYNATGGPEMSMGYFNVLPDYTGEIPEIKATSYTNVASS